MSGDTRLATKGDAGVFDIRRGARRERNAGDSGISDAPELPRADVQSVEHLSGPEFRERYGWGMRIGAGGLWGGFGLLNCRDVTFRFYISRLDDYVIVRSSSERPLLLTPTDPDAFVRALSS